MFEYPKLSVRDTERQMVDVFKGYNHNLRISDGEFFNMENLTSDFYPVLSPRRKRGVFDTLEHPGGLIAKDSLCHVDGSCFVINGYPVDLELSKGEKSLISMGAYVIIMPDKKYVNTADLTDYGSIEANFQSSQPVSFELCRVDGEKYIADFVQATEPADPGTMELWLDTSVTPNMLRQWSETSGMWVDIATTYIKITSPGLGKVFSQYDGVTISGLTGELADENGDTLSDTEQLAEMEGAAVVWNKGDDYIVVTGLLNRATTVTNSITFAREMPYMDYVVESGNRLWGCRYGIARNGDVVNELYASKLGDFKNWNCFMGISSDSYAVSLGTDGKFTGAITHLGYPVFFKENCLHKVYGTQPSNFQVQDTACRGVQEGCHKSLAIVNETLFYKARSGICAYDGSLPTEVSYQLGDVRYGQAVAGAHGNKYYVSMVDSTGEWHLFVYDASKGLWHREDHFHAMCFCSCRDEMYAIDADTGRIMALCGTGEAEDKKLRWMAETGNLALNSPDAKYVTRLTIRMMLEIGAKADVYIQYDMNGLWQQLYSLHGTSLRSFSIPVMPRRCDHMKLKIVGEGMAKLYAITKTIEQGSDWF